MRKIIAYVVAAVLFVTFNVIGSYHRVERLAAVASLIPIGVVLVMLAAARARWRMRRWARAGGWASVESREKWPWTGLHVQGAARVRQAWSRSVDGVALTVGDVSWTDAAFGGAVLEAQGRGVFVIIRLAAPSPGMAMRFPYEVVGDSPRLARPALRSAYLSGEIPPWTVRDDELFTFTATQRWITPADTDRAIRRTLRTAHLLDLISPPPTI